MDAANKPLTHAELAAEAVRVQMVWFQEYMKMGRFSTAYMREANTLLDAAEIAIVMLAEGSDLNAKTKLREAVRAAQKIRLDSVQPVPAPLETRKAFLWVAEQEGLSVTEVNGSFVSQTTQALWLAFQKGAVWAQKRMDQPPVVEAPVKKRWLA